MPRVRRGRETLKYPTGARRTTREGMATTTPANQLRPILQIVAGSEKGSQGRGQPVLAMCP